MPQPSSVRNRVDALCFTTSATSAGVQRDPFASEGATAGRSAASSSTSLRIPPSHFASCPPPPRRRLPLRRLKFTFPFRLQFSAPPAAAENADGATTGIVQKGEERRGTEGGRWVRRAGAVPAAAAACKFQRLLRKSAPSGIKTDGDAHYKVVALRKQCYFTNQSTFSRWVSEIGYFEKKRWRQIRHQVCPSCAAPHAVCAQGY